MCTVTVTYQATEVWGKSGELPHQSLALPVTTVEETHQVPGVDSGQWTVDHI